MTELEEKLKELGYEHIYANGRWYKEYDGNKSICIYTDEHYEKIRNYYIHFFSFIECQNDIDGIQQAFNEMQKNLQKLTKEEMKENEKEN